MFSIDRVTEEVYPEGFGVIVYGGTMLGGAAIDKWRQKGKPAEERTAFVQTGLTVVTLIGSGAMIGYGYYPEIGVGLLYGAGVGITLNTIRFLYAKAKKGSPGELKGKDVAALIPMATYEGKQIGNGNSGRRSYRGSSRGEELESSSEPMNVEVEQEEGSLVGGKAF